MSQASLTSYYNTRKRRVDNKLLKVDGKETKTTSSPSETVKVKGHSSIIPSLVDKKVPKSARSNLEPQEKSNTPKVCKETTHASSSNSLIKPSKSSTLASRSKSIKDLVKSNTKKKSESNDIRSAFRLQIEKTSNGSFNSDESEAEETTSVLNSTYNLDSSSLPSSLVPILRTPPKRSSVEPEEPSSDSKKKKNNFLAVERATQVTHNVKKASQPAVRKKLDMGSEPNRTEKRVQQTHEKKSSSDESPKVSSTCGGMVDLKEKLQKFDQAFQKLKDFQSNKCKITSVISTAATPRKSAPEPVKPEVPCYEKYSYLATAGPPSLTLPYRYGQLLDTFRNSDMIVSMLNNRKERCSFDKLKNGVQDMSKRSFTRSRLGQIKTVYPNAYKYEIEKNPPNVINRKPGTPLYELVISPVLNAETESDKSAATKVSNRTKSDSDDKIMSPSCLVGRKEIFKSRLLSIAMQHHQAFLSKLNPPIIIPPEKLTKWHPKFRLDSVPDIEASPLPEPPNIGKIDSAKDVLNKLKGKANERIEKALEKVSKLNPDNASQKKEEKQEVKISRGALKGISIDLLERIRAKENAKIVEEMTTNVEEQERVEMLERVPELVNILRTYFVTEKKFAMSLEDAAQRLSDSYHTALPPVEVEKHIRLIAEIFPRWLTLVPVRNNMYVKIDKNMDINVMLNNMPKK